MSDTKVIHSSDTSGHIFSLFLKYVSANVLGMIGFSCYILADTFFIARGIGSDALAALNLVLPAYSLLNGTGLMIGMGGGSRYSLSSTHPEGETHRTVFTQSVLLAVYFFRTDRTSWGRAFMPSPGSRQPDTPFCRPLYPYPAGICPLISGQ
jgi:Na+-driven multidrug efflux pump